MCCSMLEFVWENVDDIIKMSKKTSQKTRKQQTPVGTNIVFVLVLSCEIYADVYNWIQLLRTYGILKNKN